MSEFRANVIEREGYKYIDKYTGLIDADIIAYRVAAAGEEDSEEDVLIAVDNYMNQIARDARLRNYILFLTNSESNFRIDVAKTKPYKGNRKDTSRPQHLGAVRGHLMEHYKAIMVIGYEADDAIASAANRIRRSVIMTIDKDLLQCQGFHYNFVKDEWMTVLPAQASHNLWMQVVTGDSTDNIPGLPKVGPAKWQRAVEEHEDEKDFSTIAWELYQEREASRELFNEQLDLVRMRLDMTYLPYEDHIIELTYSEEDFVTGALEGFDI